MRCWNSTRLMRIKGAFYDSERLSIFIQTTKKEPRSKKISANTFYVFRVIRTSWTSTIQNGFYKARFFPLIVILRKEYIALLVTRMSDWKMKFISTGQDRSGGIVVTCHIYYLKKFTIFSFTFMAHGIKVGSYFYFCFLWSFFFLSSC